MNPPEFVLLRSSALPSHQAVFDRSSVLWRPFPPECLFTIESVPESTPVQCPSCKRSEPLVKCRLHLTDLACMVLGVRARAEAGPLIGATFAALVQKPFLPAKEEASTDVLGGCCGQLCLPEVTLPGEFQTRAGLMVRRCAGAQVRRCAGAQVRRCTDVWGGVSGACFPCGTPGDSDR